jgi:hypothetical protein
MTAMPEACNALFDLRQPTASKPANIANRQFFSWAHELCKRVLESPSSIIERRKIGGFWVLSHHPESAELNLYGSFQV